MRWKNEKYSIIPHQRNRNTKHTKKKWRATKEKTIDIDELYANDTVRPNFYVVVVPDYKVHYSGFEQERKPGVLSFNSDQIGSSPRREKPQKKTFARASWALAEGWPLRCWRHPPCTKVCSLKMPYVFVSEGTLVFVVDGQRKSYNHQRLPPSSATVDICGTKQKDFLLPVSNASFLFQVNTTHLK